MQQRTIGLLVCFILGQVAQRNIIINSSRRIKLFIRPSSRPHYTTTFLPAISDCPLGLSCTFLFLLPGTRNANFPLISTFSWESISSTPFLYFFLLVHWWHFLGHKEKSFLVLSLSSSVVMAKFFYITTRVRYTSRGALTQRQVSH